MQSFVGGSYRSNLFLPFLPLTTALIILDGLANEN
jgi:hypothetical protein